MRNIEHHCRSLGGVIANLQSLEFYIRCVLSELPGSAPHGLQEDQNLYECKVGHELLESPMTNFDTLTQLISKYNHAAQSFDWEPVDAMLVEIRDALAHGRVAYSGDEEHYARLMKFDKPRNGKVRVCFNVELSPGWFDQQIRATKRALDSVEQASHVLQEHKVRSQVSSTA